MHVLLINNHFDDGSQSIFEAVLINPDFEGLSDIQKLCFLLCDSQIVRSSAKV